MKRLWMLNRAISTRSLLHIPGKYFGGMHKLFPIARNFSLRFFDLCVLKHGVLLFSFCNALNFPKAMCLLWLVRSYSVVFRETPVNS